ncbi:MAG TPA: hypothetical protein VHW01_09015 [Polyangiaceae bacterium]|nr:hypothetical protein [Polyangiaceae bacterium]
MNSAGTRGHAARCAAAMLTGCALAGCGGGVPLLHPARVLSVGQTSFGAGMSDRSVLGAERKALASAEQRSPDSALPVTDPGYTRGVLVAVAEGPALVPWASARVGIPGSNEGGLSYTGQALRADARHAFEWDNSALSIGLGFTGHGFGQSALELPGADLNHAHGVGLDLPLLFGYHTDADLISVWAGLRGAYDHWSGTLTLDNDAPFSLSAGRLSGGPVLGLAVGLSPLWVAAELEVDYSHVTGTLDRAGGHYDAQLDGWSARPAGALIAKF